MPERDPLHSTLKTAAGLQKVVQFDLGFVSIATADVAVMLFCVLHNDRLTLRIHADEILRHDLCEGVWRLKQGIFAILPSRLASQNHYEELSKCRYCIAELSLKHTHAA